MNTKRFEQLLNDFHVFADIEIIRSKGFNPIGISYGWYEIIYIFNSEEEAELAGDLLEEKEKIISGFFYSKEEFLNKQKENKYLKVKWL
jgi:hypothetical protein